MKTEPIQQGSMLYNALDYAVIEQKDVITMENVIRDYINILRTEGLLEKYHREVSFSKKLFIKLKELAPE